MSPKAVAIGFLSAFVVGVSALTLGGKQILHSIEQADTTIGYLDLARQATEKRNYPQADEYYKQALKFAEQSDKPTDNVPLVLGCYSDFLRLKRNPLRDVKRANEIDTMAQAMHRKNLTAAR